MAEKDPKIQKDFALDLQKVMNKVDMLVSHMDSVFSSIEDKSKRVTKNAQDQNAAYQKGGTQLGAIRDLNASLVKDLEDQTKSTKVKTLAMKTGIDVQIVELQLAKQQAIADAQRAGASKDTLQKIRSQYDQTIVLTKEMVHQAKLKKEEQEAAERIEKYDEERVEMMSKINQKASLLKGIFTDQRLAQAVLVKQLISGYDSVKETFTDFRKEGLTVTQAFKETGTAMSAMFSTSGASLKENQELMAGFAKSMGDGTKFSRETVVEVGKLAKTLGIGMEEAGQLQGQLQNMAGATAESATNAMEFAGGLAKAAHVAPGAVMKDMAANAEDIALNTKNGGKDMAVVSVAAHKLGMEMSSLNKMSAGLLDFESSVNKQMEASVLLGKEINLDKAREAALNGDILGATQEMLKNVGGEAEYNAMNVVQRKALAESMGVSVQDLSKMVKNQDQLANLTEEQQMALAEGSLSMDEVLANAGGFASKLKDGGLTLVGMVGSVGGFADGLKSATGLAKGLFDGFKSGAGIVSKVGGALKGGAGLTSNIKAPEVPAKADSLGAGKGAGGGMKGLASGFKAMAGGKVTQGIGNLALAGPALILAIGAIPFLGVITFLGAAAGLGLSGLSEGLKGKGMGAALVSVGVANLSAFGIAGAIGMLAIPFMLTMLLGNFIGMGLQGLAVGLKAMGNPAVALGVGILSVLVLSVGAGMLMLGIGIGVAAAGMSLLVTSLKDVPFQNLMALPIAFAGIAGGLGLMALSGMMALPVIGALIALATVAPALVGLGAALGGMFGGGGGEKEDKMDLLIQKIDKLIGVASAGGTVNMDGKKVGDIVRLGVNSSGVR